MNPTSPFAALLSNPQTAGPFLAMLMQMSQQGQGAPGGGGQRTPGFQQAQQSPFNNPMVLLMLQHLMQQRGQGPQGAAAGAQAGAQQGMAPQGIPAPPAPAPTGPFMNTPGVPPATGVTPVPAPSAIDMMSQPTMYGLT